MKKSYNLRLSLLRLAVVSAMPFAVASHAYAGCDSSGGVVNCTGALGGVANGAIMVSPANYAEKALDDTLEASSATIVGYSHANDFSFTGIGSMALSVPRFSALNIGAGTTSPTYGTAPDLTTTVVTGLKAVPGFYDPFNRVDTSLATLPAAGDNLATQAASTANGKPLLNFEAVEINQAGTVNNFGVITNTTFGSAVSPVSGNTFLVTNGPKIYTEGGADSLPYRTIGVWVNGSDTKLNNYGVITLGVNGNAITNSYPGVPVGMTATSYTSSGGTAFAETYCTAADVTNNVANCGAVSNIKTLTVGTSKPTVYTVLATSDTDDFQSNVRINNYNKIGFYQFSGAGSTAYASGVAVEVKENIIDTHVYNAKGAVIEGVSSLLVASGARTASGTNGVSSTYATASGGVSAIGTDNNAFQLYVDNYGTIQSTNVAGSAYGTAIGSSTGEMYLNNWKDASIKGDITVGSSENKFVFTNAGTLTGSIKITPDSSSLTPVLQSDGSYSDVATPTTTKNLIVIQPVINKAGGGNTANEIGQITGGIYVGAGTGTHPFELDVKPVVASGVMVKTGDTYQYAAYNIAIAPTANETTYTNSVANPASVITSANLHLVDSALVHWNFVANTTNQITATVADASTVAGISSNGASAINALMSGGGELASQLQNLSTSDDLVKASNQIRPEINGATHQASMNVTDKVFGLVGSRLDEIHLASVAGRSGVATGDETRAADGTGVWMQAFGAKGSQDRRANTDGYSTDAYGFAVGADQLIDDETRVGFVGSYGQSRVLSQGDNLGDRTSIDSYQGAIYGSTLLRKIYLNATLGLGYHDYTSNRLVLDNGIKGSHDAWQYSGKLDAGYPIKFNAVTLVPVASLAYSHLAESGYTETGVGALSIGGRDTDSFKTGLGAKALVPLFDSTVSAGLELRALWQHEFADASIDTTARFVEGGSSFTTKGVDLERDSANLGASLRLFGVMDGVKQSLNVNYDAEVKSQYINQTASLQARFDF